MASDQSRNWTTVAKLADLKDGDVIAVKLGDRAIALYRINGDIYATDNVCTHAFAMLSDGWLEDYTIECPLHAGRFDVRTGKALGPPVEEDIGTYDVQIVGEDIQVSAQCSRSRDIK